MTIPSKENHCAASVPPDVGSVYRVTNYHPGDSSRLASSSSSKPRGIVNAPLASVLNVGAEIEIAYSSPAQIMQVTT